MLVSHNYKFIFIKTRKTANTSTEAFLERLCVDPDIMESYSPEHSADEIESEFGIIGSRWRGKVGKRKWFNHKPVPEIKRDLGEDLFNSYRKVCNIRNPYDLAVSYYHFMGNKELSKTRFESFIKNPSTIRTLKTNSDLWSDEGVYNFDYIRMESLQSDLDAFLQKIDCRSNASFFLPHFKKSEGRENYRNYYNEASRQAVEQIYGKEIELFSYKF